MLLTCRDKHPSPSSFQTRLLEEELRDYQRAQEEALTKRQLLEQTLKDLEYELEAKSHLKDDRSRLLKQLEVCGRRGCGTRGKQTFRSRLSLWAAFAFFSLEQQDSKVIS